MTDHELVLTAAYAFGLLCLIAEALWVRARHRRALDDARDEARDEARDQMREAAEDVA